MKKTRLMGSALASLGLVVGFATMAGAMPNTSYNHVDYGSHSSHATTSSTQTVAVKNDNKLSLTNSNHQNAYSGEATVVHNQTGGSAATGSASNSNSLSMTATVANAKPTVPAMPSIVSPDNHESSIKTTSLVTVDNTNKLTVDNNNCQTATSGDAVVAGNQTAGSATTGNVSNSNSTSVTFNVSN